MGIEFIKAQADAYNFAFGFANTSVLKCAVELEIPDLLQKHGDLISLSELSSLVKCTPDTLYRLMRYLTYHGIFKKTEAPDEEKGENVDGDMWSTVYYSQTPLSLMLTRDNMGAFVVLQGGVGGPPMVDVLKNKMSAEVKHANGENAYDEEPVFRTKEFTDAMACHARVTTLAIIDNYPELFRGITSLVDVGGRHGMALCMLVKAFPWVRGTVLDLPEVAASAPYLEGIEFVGGSMFESVPKADAVMLMWVLHNWSDEACIDILKKCKKAVPADTGKVIIVDAIIHEGGEVDEFTGARLAFDITTMAITAKGKERTYAEWVHLLHAAGFSTHTVKDIKTIEFVIEAYP